MQNLFLNFRVFVYLHKTWKYLLLLCEHLYCAFYKLSCHLLLNALRYMRINCGDSFIEETLIPSAVG